MGEESSQVSDTSFLLNTLNLSSRKKHRNIVASQFSPVLFYLERILSEFSSDFTFLVKKKNDLYTNLIINNFKLS